MKDESRFPQTMEVAISVDRFDLIALAEGEADLRLFAGMQLLALIALLGLERYPLDVVLRQHGMLHGADLDMDDAVFYCPDRNMLLHGGVGGAGNNLAHPYFRFFHGRCSSVFCFHYIGIMILFCDKVTSISNDLVCPYPAA